LAESFSQGAWMRFPVDVGAGGSVLITADRLEGVNAVLSGLFLGGEGPPPQPSLTWVVEPQGDWVGRVGAEGFVLGAWEGSADLVGLPAGVSLVVERGYRHRWTDSTMLRRALQAPDESHRRAGVWSDSGQVRLRLDFEHAFAGDLRVYAVDWSSTGRRQRVEVDDGSGVRGVTLAESFSQGAWMRFPVDVGAGGSVLITADRLEGVNAVLSGLFLDDAATYLGLATG
jgi:hypothetical protein